MKIAIPLCLLFALAACSRDAAQTPATSTSKAAPAPADAVSPSVTMKTIALRVDGMS